MTRSSDIDVVAVTEGPGLVGALLVGVAYGKALAFARGIPVVGVHHMEGHLFATSLEHADAVPPFIALLVSGGHTLLLDVAAWGNYRVLGTTRDDAAGEAFDKIAKLLGMPYPGGPHIERAAATGDPKRFRFSRPMVRSNSRPGDGDYYDLSFSGLKTAVRLATQKVDMEARARESRARLSGCAHRHARREDVARRAGARPHARRARRRRGVQSHARRADARAAGGGWRNRLCSIGAAGHRQRRDDRPSGTLPLRSRRARILCALRRRLTPHSRLSSRMTVHHPFSYKLGIFTFTGFGIAVLLAFAIAQVICATRARAPRARPRADR